MTQQSQSLTGVWHGLYSYQAFKEPVYFVATLIDGGSFISGSTHESEVGENGAPLTLFASVEGTNRNKVVHFTKSYDGASGWDHAVTYIGTLNDDTSEIEGIWTIGMEATGRFLMIRSRGATEKAVRKAYQKA
ncbi:MAG: hypothetical protein ACRCWF_17425 [Beijerinckiaceae bacterium]